MLIEMRVNGLTVDPSNNAPIVVLREKDGSRILPIWIGVVEASAIAFELEKVKLARPMTHDLLRAAVEALGGVVERVTVTALRDSTYFATVRIKRDGDTMDLDARPSDALALALRARAPVLCDADVLEQAHARQKEAAAKVNEPNKKSATPPLPPVVDIENERSEAGPKPIFGDGSQSVEEIFANLKPEDFGKYKM